LEDLLARMTVPVLLGAAAVVLPMSAAAQGSVLSDRFSLTIPRTMAPTMMPIIPDSDEIYTFEASYTSCYRIRRCSAHDLYRFRDRPNWLTRLAPVAPAEGGADDLFYVWVFVPVTPEENIVPKFRMASQVRDEHRAVSRPIDRSN
jgi:hypothetical protein